MSTTVHPGKQVNGLVNPELDQAKVMKAIENYFLEIVKYVSGEIEFRDMLPGARRGYGGTCFSVGDRKGDPFRFHASYAMYKYPADKIDGIFDQFVQLFKQNGWFEGIYAPAPEHNDPARSVNGFTADGYDILVSRSTPGGLAIKAVSPLFPAPPSGRGDPELYMPFALTKDGPKTWDDLKHEYDLPSD